MPILYAKDIDELKNIEKIDNCWFCNTAMDVDGFTTSRIPNCLICENGHRIHKTCFDNLPVNGKICKCYATINKNCKSDLGYGYFSITAGKRKTMKTRKTRTNKKKRAKNHKKRKTYKRK